MKIEDGKFYKRRDGKVVQIEWSLLSGFHDGQNEYYNNGSSRSGLSYDRRNQDCDLIQECTADGQPVHEVDQHTHKPDLGVYGASGALYGAATDREALCVVVGMLGAGADGDKVMAYIKAYLEGKR